MNLGNLDLNIIFTIPASKVKKPRNYDFLPHHLHTVLPSQSILYGI
jgi:hypothetical protein